jgi:MOSC domain-containing protein
MSPVRTRPPALHRPHPDDLYCGVVEARVERIAIAPVKSLGLAHPATVELEAGGVRGDRRFWLVDEDGRLFNNKRNGPMVTIRPTWNETTRELRLDFPDGARVEGVVELGEPVPAVLYGRPHASRRVIGPWEKAISARIGRPLTLLWSDEHATDRGAVGGVVSLVSRGSLLRLGEEAAASRPVDGRRFRMTFEVDGVGPHAEDGWIGRTVRLGSAAIEVTGDVGRCLVTSHDPDTGVTDLDTLGTLARYRPNGHTAPLPLGVFCSVATPGRVSVGDAVIP